MVQEGLGLRELTGHCVSLLPGRSAPDTEQGFPLVEAGSQDTICQPRGGVRSMRCEGGSAVSKCSISAKLLRSCAQAKDALQVTSLQYPASTSDSKLGETFLQRAGALSPSREFCAQVVGDMRSSWTVAVT